MKSTFGPAYRLVTPSLVLRCWHPMDTAALMAFVERNPEIFRGWPSWPHQEPLEEDDRLRCIRKWRAEFDLDRSWSYAARDAATDELLGGIIVMPRDNGASAEVMPWLATDEAAMHAEAAGAVTRAAFEVIGVDRLFVACAEASEGANAALRGLGLALEGTLRQPVEGPRRREHMWSMLAEEFAASPAACAPARGFDGLGNVLL